MSPWYGRGARWLLALFLLGSALPACGDSTVSSNTNIEDEEREDTPTGMPGLTNQYFLVANGSSEIEVPVGGDAPLSVFLYSKKTGEPVASESIAYEILEGGELASLGALNGTTDDTGESGVELRALDTPGQVNVKVTHPSANDIEFAISIVPRPVGGIDVALTNTAPTIMTLSDVNVRLYESVGYSCNEFLPLRQQPTELLLRNAPSTSQPVAFDDLDVTKKYMITGIARGERGQIAAAGCVEDIRVDADDRSQVELPLQLIPINPVGRYQVTSNWDFTQAVADSGPVGSTIVRILNIFQNPGQALYDEIINLVSFAVGGLISGAIDTFLSATGLDDQFQGMINDFIENNEVLRKVRDAGRDIRDVIANLEVTSELTIGKLSSSYEFTGVDNWLGVTVYWRWNCDANAPPECGAIPLLVDGGNDVAELGILSSQWSGRVVAYDQLQIDQHPLTLRYGRLIIYVLNEVILPALTDGNATSLSEAFAYWIGCRNLAESITGSDGEECALGVCIYADDIEGFCQSATTTVFGFADALVRNLEFDIGLRVGGGATLIEEDSDGFVDRMIDGTFEGYMTTSGGGGNGQGMGMGGQGTTAAPINATWEAIKLDYQTDNL